MQRGICMPVWTLDNVPHNTLLQLCNSVFCRVCVMQPSLCVCDAVCVEVDSCCGFVTVSVRVYVAACVAVCVAVSIAVCVAVGVAARGAVSVTLQALVVCLHTQDCNTPCNTCCNSHCNTHCDMICCRSRVSSYTQPSVM